MHTAKINSKASQMSLCVETKSIMATQKKSPNASNRSNFAKKKTISHFHPSTSINHKSNKEHHWAVGGTVGFKNGSAALLWHARAAPKSTLIKRFFFFCLVCFSFERFGTPGGMNWACDALFTRFLVGFPRWKGKHSLFGFVFNLWDFDI